MNTADKDKRLSESSYIPGHDIEHAALAYVKPVATQTGNAFMLCSSDGTPLATYASPEVAQVAASQHDLELVQIH